MLFECHITLHLDDADVGNHLAKEFHWKTSQIERDPVLGNNAYFYLTTHASNYIEIYTKMNRTSLAFESLTNRTVVREKIELIMYDTKVKV